MGTESWNTRWYTMHTKKKTKAPTDGKNSEDELIKKYEPSNASKVDAIVRGLGIDLSNICCYMPQENVDKFQRQDPQTLLTNTQQSLQPELLDTHDKLKKYGDEM